MTIEMIATVAVSVIAALSSAKAWEFWKQRLALKTQQHVQAQQDQHLYRDDLRKEVSDMRIKFEIANDKIVELTKKLAEMVVRVEFLEHEKHSLQGAHAK